MKRELILPLCGLAVLALAACQSAPAGHSPRSLASPPATTSPAVPAAPREEPAEAQIIAAVQPGNSVFFARGAAEVDAAGRAMLQSHAERLRADGKLQVTLTGYTDDLGSRAYNLAIADKRVAAVFAILREMGVPSRQMRRSGMGAETMGRDCQSAECRRLMRRVELVYRK